MFGVSCISGRSFQPITLGTTVAPDRKGYGKGLGGEQGAATKIAEKQSVDAFIDRIIVTLLIQIGSPLQQSNK